MTDILGSLHYLAPNGAENDYERLYQIMPEGRVRVHPDAVPLLAAWLSAACTEWDRMLRTSHAGLDARGRYHLRAQKTYARHALGAVKVLGRRLLETVEHSVMDEFIRACATAIGKTSVKSDVTGQQDVHLFSADPQCE